MLPYLKKLNEAGVFGPVETIKREPDEGASDEYDPVESAFEDICHAVERKDYKAGAEALKAAFQLLEEEPHHEGEHLE